MAGFSFVFAAVWETRMNTQIRCFVLSLLLLTATGTSLCSASPPVSVSVSDLGTLGGPMSAGYGVNNKGQVAGTSLLPDGKTFHGFFYSNGKMTDLGTLGGDQSEARAINDAGEVTGKAEIKGKNEQSHAFLWQEGKMTSLGTSRADDSDGLAINSAGQVVGRIARGGQLASHACFWKEGKVVTVDNTDYHAGSESNALNSLGQIVGTVREAGRTTTSPYILTFFADHAVLWKKGKMSDLTPASTEASLANAINDSGEIVGAISVGPDRALHVCSWQNGRMTDLGTLAGQDTVAFAVNGTGLIVGGTNPFNIEENGKEYGDPDEPQHAFCCSKGQMIDLNDLIDPASGWELSDAHGVSDTNYVTGTGIYKGQLHAYLLKLPAVF